MKTPIYLDYAATTPIDPRVAMKMVDFLKTSHFFGNSSSSHFYGKEAREAIELARNQVATLLGADSTEIIFTSGATESNNLALKGAAELYQSKGKHIITLKTEHPSVLDCCQELEKRGYRVSYLKPETNGLINLDRLKDEIKPDTILISMMHVNNEIGVIQDLNAIANLTSERGILFHVDATQSVGKLPLRMDRYPVDMLSFTAHKLYGPKGIGGLFLRNKPRVRVAPQIQGGGQERGMRSGTLATHQIVGMGEAFAIAQHDMEKDQARILNLRNFFCHRLMDLPIKIHFPLELTLPNILNVSFNNRKVAELIQQIPELALSSGSACHAKKGEPSYVLRALGYSKEEAASSIRFSFGRFTTEAEIEETLALLGHLLTNA